MPDSRIESLEIQFDRQRRFREDPFAFVPLFFWPYRLRILMVTDRSASFGRADFGLSALLAALSQPPGPWVSLEVTKAHRRSDANADLNHFQFDAVDLSQFDQIWMFAVERANSEVTTAELAAIARFM